MTDPLHHLREGTAVGRGSFQLDATRAVQKLRDFRLPSPHHYLLEFVRAAHLLDATYIQITLENTSAEFAFDGHSLSHTDLQLLFSAPFAHLHDDRQRALRHLAIGANAARNLGLSELRLVQFDDPLRGICLVEDSIRPLTPDELPTPAETSLTTRITLRESLRLGNLSRHLFPRRGVDEQLSLLEEHCAHSPLPILVNGSHISNGPTLSPNLRGTVSFHDDHEQGVLGSTLGTSMIQVRVIQSGVLLGTSILTHYGLGAEAILSSTKLSTNLSGTDFIKDDAWHELRNRTLELATSSFIKLLDELSGQTHLPPTLYDKIAGLTDGATQALTDTTRVRLLEACHDFLERRAEGLPTAYKDLLSWLRRFHQWRAHPFSLTPDAHTFHLPGPVVIDVFHPNTRRLEDWEVSLHIHEDTRDSVIHYGLASHHFSTTPLPIGIPSLEARVHGPLEPNDAFDHPVKTTALRDVLLAIADQIFPLFVQSSPDLPDEHCIEFLIQWATGQLRTDLQRWLSWRLPTSTGPGAVWRTSSLQDRLALLSPLSDRPLFEDLNDNAWSLADLARLHDTLSMRYLFTTRDRDSRVDTLLERGYPVFSADAPWLDALDTILGMRPFLVSRLTVLPDPSAPPPAPADRLPADRLPAFPPASSDESPTPTDVEPTPLPSHATSALPPRQGPSLPTPSPELRDRKARLLANLDEPSEDLHEPSEDLAPPSEDPPPSSKPPFAELLHQLLTDHHLLPPDLTLRFDDGLSQPISFHDDETTIHLQHPTPQAFQQEPDSPAIQGLLLVAIASCLPSPPPLNDLLKNLLTPPPPPPKKPPFPSGK